MKNLNFLNKYRKNIYGTLGDNYNGVFVMTLKISQRTEKYSIIASRDKEWEHVSISCKNRCPNWEEMHHFKEMFFHDDECVMQLHPKKEDYVNNHPYCLHLWRPVQDVIPIPPKILV